jgi:very-short-patch-repair endonuclease
MDWSNLQKDYERLGSFKAVAKEYGTYPETVSRAAKRLGIATKHSLNIDWSPLQELYDSGMTQAQLADHFGCSPSLVSAAMKDIGIETRKTGSTGWKWTEEQHEKRRAAVERGAFKGNHREHFRRLGSRTPKENSPSEKLFHLALVKACLSFETQSRELERYWPDIKLHQQPILIEVDGWGHNMASRREHDEQRDSALTAAGYTVVRFTNEQVDDDPDGCVQQLMDRFGLLPEENPVALVRDRRSYD